MIPLIGLRNTITLGGFVVLMAVIGWLYATKAAVERDFSKYREEVALAQAESYRTARLLEQHMQIQIEKVIKNEHSKQKVLLERLARADAVTGGLRDEIARLNARTLPTDSAAAAYAREARVARELLGACADRYKEVARGADELRDQVSGLQDYVKGTLQTISHP